jgi:hypothetical protein
MKAFLLQLGSIVLCRRTLHVQALQQLLPKSLVEKRFLNKLAAIEVFTVWNNVSWLYKNDICGNKQSSTYQKDCE